MVRYYLSNRQIKELGNGKALQIALPDPGLNTDDGGELVRWAQSVLVDVDPAAFRRADRESVEVFSESGQPGQLADEVGSIYLAGMPQTNRLHWYVEVVVVTLCLRERPRSTYPVQWPARYVI